MSLLRKKDNSSQHWLTISDLMSGLMIIFIAISFMRSTYLEQIYILFLLTKFYFINQTLTHLKFISFPKPSHFFPKLTF